MNISIFGMGYVGAVCAACFAERGHTAIGVDVSADKIRLINAGKTPIVEPGLEELLASGVKSGHLRATSAAAQAMESHAMSNHRLVRKSAVCGRALKVSGESSGGSN